MKTKFEKNNYYTYEGINAYCFKDNRLVLSDGRLVRRYVNKFTPDTVGHGSTDKNGYLRMKIDSQLVAIHRIVAISFIPNPNDYTVVDHINENKKDNRVENLRWTTLEENTARSYIRDDRSLNEARKERVKAKEYYDAAEHLVESVEKEKAELRNDYLKVVHIGELLLAELRTITGEYYDRMQVLLKEPTQKAIYVAESKYLILEKKRLSIGDHITKIGNPICVNGIVYESVRAAARFITLEEFSKGNTRKLETIRKELKKVYTGFRGEHTMYGCYEITRVP